VQVSQPFSKIVWGFIFLAALGFAPICQAQDQTPSQVPPQVSMTPDEEPSTSTDLYIMLGSDFDRPGLLPKANYNIGIGHTFGFLKKDPFGDDDVRGQMVGVFDTETGKLQLAKNASPVLSAGHNYTLTADGSRFAILREGAVEIYDLPPAVTTPAPAVAAAK